MITRMASALSIAVLAAGAFAEPPALAFERQRIGEVTYEAAAAFDVNNNGIIDIVSGEYWFEGPDFETAHRIATIHREGDYYDDFSNYPMDVNGNGYLDIITGGWWNQTMKWRENPAGGSGEWTTHRVAEVGNIERNCFYDINGDGHKEVFSTTGPLHFFRLKRDADGRGTGAFAQYTIANAPGGHGFGAGDINGNGRKDLVFATGWMEAPADPFDTDAWVFHQEFHLGLASVPIIVHDVNGDGKADLIVGNAHGYGLFWLEQSLDDSGARTWIRHDIERGRSQFHEMQLADIDNDGELELVTGKRYRAHMGSDPGANDPLGVYYYKINGGEFVRHTIDYGPADRASGVGIYMWIEDVTGNGWKDIVAPGKEGLYLFRNLGLRETAAARKDMP